MHDEKTQLHSSSAYDKHISPPLKKNYPALYPERALDSTGYFVFVGIWVLLFPALQRGDPAVEPVAVLFSFCLKKSAQEKGSWRIEFRMYDTGYGAIINGTSLQTNP